MSKPEDDFALLVEGGNAVRLDLARNLLEEAGLPCLIHGPDFDVAELGFAAHAAVRHANLYVPTEALEKARALLAEAWGAEGEDSADPASAAIDLDADEATCPACQGTIPSGSERCPECGLRFA